MRLSPGQPPVVRLQPRTGLDAGLSAATRISIIFLGICAFFAVLGFAKSVLAPVFLAVITGLMMTPLARRLEKFIPTGLAAGLVVLIFLGGLSLTIMLFYLPLSVWMERLPVIWNDLQRHLVDWRQVFNSVSEIQEQVREATGGESKVRVEIDEGSTVTNIASLAPELVAQIILFLGSLYFFLAERDRIRLMVLSLCMNRRLRLRMAHIFRDVEWFVSRYLLSITAINFILGLAVAAAMTALGVPQPLLWGMLAFSLNYIIYIGPAVMAAILIAVGLSGDVKGIAIFYPAMAYLTINMIEANIVTPQVIGRFFTLNPFFVILALSLWIWLWGAVGGLVAVPAMLVGYAILRNLMPLARPRENPTVQEKAIMDREPLAPATRF